MVIAIGVVLCLVPIILIALWAYFKGLYSAVIYALEAIEDECEPMEIIFRCLVVLFGIGFGLGCAFVTIGMIFSI